MTIIYKILFIILSTLISSIIMLSLLPFCILKIFIKMIMIVVLELLMILAKKTKDNRAINAVNSLSEICGI